MLKIFILVITIFSFLFLGLLLNLLSPTTAGPFGILVVFFFAYLSSLGVVTFLLLLANRVAMYLSSIFITRKPIGRLLFRRAYFFSTIIAAAPIIIIGLQSVGSVGFYEYFLVTVFVVIGCLYISKRIR